MKVCNSRYSNPSSPSSIARPTLRILTFIYILFLAISCGGDKSSGGGTTTTSTPAPAPTPAPTVAYMWPTTSTYQGNHQALRSDASADAECTARAATDTTSLRTGFTHKAILTRTGGVHPNTLIAATTPIFRGDDTEDIVANYSDFFDRNKNAAHPVKDRVGVTPVADYAYWTGLNLTGIGEDCNGWTSNLTTDLGGTGAGHVRNAPRYGGCTPTPCQTICSNHRRLLCLSY